MAKHISGAVDGEGLEKVGFPRTRNRTTKGVPNLKIEVDRL